VGVPVQDQPKWAIYVVFADSGGSEMKRMNCRDPGRVDNGVMEGVSGGRKRELIHRDEYANPSPVSQKMMLGFEHVHVGGCVVYKSSTAC